MKTVHFAMQTWAKVRKPQAGSQRNALASPSAPCLQTASDVDVKFNRTGALPPLVQQKRTAEASSSVPKACPSTKRLIHHTRQGVHETMKDFRVWGFPYLRRRRPAPTRPHETRSVRGNRASAFTFATRRRRRQRRRRTRRRRGATTRRAPVRPVDEHAVAIDATSVVAAASPVALPVARDPSLVGQPELALQRANLPLELEHLLSELPRKRSRDSEPVRRRRRGGRRICVRSRPRRVRFLPGSIGRAVPAVLLLFSRGPRRKLRHAPGHDLLEHPDELGWCVRRTRRIDVAQFCVGERHG